MSNTKLSFTIDNAELIDDNVNSNFALLSLDFFASGANKHDTYISEETLLEKADTIKNCPVVWKYDPLLDDIGTHDPEEVPCGFIPHSTEIKSKKLDDGRTMLSVLSYIWKRYSGKLLEFFRRDGDKPVSVEMTVFDAIQRPDNLLELKDYKFEAVTVLGSLVSPAIPMAKATVLQFSEEYKTAYDKEFKLNYNALDFTIPTAVKENAEKALKLYSSGAGTIAPSVAVAMAKSLVHNDVISISRLRQLANYFKKTPLVIETDLNFYGGIEAAHWAENLHERISEVDSEYSKGVFITMPYKKLGDINPALKGIEPPITLGQANAIAKQADSIGIDEKKNGWAIAISSFKKTHRVENGRWVKKESMEEETMEENNLRLDEPEKEEKSVKDEKGKNTVETGEDTADIVTMNEDGQEVTEALPEGEIQMADTTKPEDNIAETDENPEAKPDETLEMAESETKPDEETADETIEEGAGDEEKKFALPENFIVDEVTKLFAESKDPSIVSAQEELSKESCDPAVLLSGMYAAMRQQANKITELEKSIELGMAENKDLKAFKEEINTEKKNLEVDRTLAEMASKVVIPEEAMQEFRESAEKYSFEEIDAWKNECKAKSFDFALKDTGEKDEVEKIGLSWSSTGLRKPNSDVWAG